MMHEAVLFAKPWSISNGINHDIIHLTKQALVFTCLQYKSSENTVGKGEIARNEQFLLFPQCFPPVWKAFCHFQRI